jgi:hypothetical protein
VRRACWLRSLLALGLLLVATGCKVTTRVAVTAAPNGSGTLAVTVTLDAQAVAAVGNLAQQLQTADLTKAGWLVAGPVPSAGGSETVTVRHTFSSPEELHALAAQLAGSGPEASRPFQLDFRRTHSWWHTGTELSGVVDLKCGLSCFGDAGLQSTLGSPVGVHFAPLAHPSQTFAFSLSAALNGHVVSTNAPSRNGSVETWTPVLGETTAVLVKTQAVDTGHVVLTGVLAAVGLIVVVVALVLAWRWRRRRRRRAAGAVPSHAALELPPLEHSD